MNNGLNVVDPFNNDWYKQMHNKDRCKVIQMSG